MKKTITIIMAILFCQISFAQKVKPKNDAKNDPCPYPKDALHNAKTQKEQQAIMRTYIECKQNAKEGERKKEDAEKERQRDANRVGDNPSRGSSNSRNASNNSNGGRQRHDPNKERQHQRYEQRQRENQQRLQEAARKKREIDGN